MTSIHPTALVRCQGTAGATISLLEPFSIIEADVKIGDGTTIASHVLIANGARIGKNCKIHKGAVIATIPQDLKFGFEETTFEIAIIPLFASSARSIAARASAARASLVPTAC